MIITSIDFENLTIANATNDHPTSIIMVIQCVSPKLEEAGSLVITFTLQVTIHRQIRFTSRIF